MLFNICYTGNVIYLGKHSMQDFVFNIVLSATQAIPNLLISFRSLHIHPFQQQFIANTLIWLQEKTN